MFQIASLCHYIWLTLASSKHIKTYFVLLACLQVCSFIIIVVIHFLNPALYLFLYLFFFGINKSHIYYWLFLLQFLLFFKKYPEVNSCLLLLILYQQKQLWKGKFKQCSDAYYYKQDNFIHFKQFETCCVNRPVAKENLFRGQLCNFKYSFWLPD
jgi:hypothetical protein